MLGCSGSVLAVARCGGMVQFQAAVVKDDGSVGMSGAGVSRERERGREGEDG